MSNIINILVTIDTFRVIRDNPNPSKDQNHPTGLAHTYQYMVVSNGAAINGSQGGAELNFKASVGDEVRFHGVSEYDNFENPLLIYKIEKSGGTQVFDDFESKTFTKTTPVPGGKNVLPPQFKDMDFWFYQSAVLTKGTQNFTIWFALYQGKELYGYFYWDPTITVEQ